MYGTKKRLKIETHFFLLTPRKKGKIEAARLKN
jgi:hypothetical protein